MSPLLKKVDSNEKVDSNLVTAVHLIFWLKIRKILSFGGQVDSNFLRSVFFLVFFVGTCP